MQASIVLCVAGFFAFDDKNKIVDKILFPRNGEKIAQKIEDTIKGKNDEFLFLIKNLKKKGYNNFIFEDSYLDNIAKEKLGLNVSITFPSEAGDNLRSRLGRYLFESGFIGDSEEMYRILHQALMYYAKMKINESIQSRDLLILQTIQALDDIEKILNLLSGRIREWYGIHFPELSRLIEKHEVYARLVKDIGCRDNFDETKLKERNLSDSRISKIMKASKMSMGAGLVESDFQQIETISQHVLDLYSTKISLEKYLDNLMNEVATNIRKVAGSTVGARLINLAGGLANLAKKPASTIQILGAEKALFRSMKTGAPPPKHGIIFQHSIINKTKKKNRGRVARTLAGVIAIAARADAFTGRYIGDKLVSDMHIRIKKIEGTC